MCAAIYLLTTDLAQSAMVACMSGFAYGLVQSLITLHQCRETNRAFTWLPAAVTACFRIGLHCLYFVILGFALGGNPLRLIAIGFTFMAALHLTKIAMLAAFMRKPEEA